jgi:hypothetical protein
MSTAEVKESISQIISKEIEKSVILNNLNPELITDEIWKWLLNNEIITMNVPEAACGCCEMND